MAKSVKQRLEEQMSGAVLATQAPRESNGRCQKRTVEIPLGDLVPGGNERGLHVDIRLDREQSRVLRRAAAALDHQQAMLRNGKRVTTWRDALRWILEQVQI